MQHATCDDCDDDVAGTYLGLLLLASVRFLQHGDLVSQSLDFIVDEAIGGHMGADRFWARFGGLLYPIALLGNVQRLLQLLHFALPPTTICVVLSPDGEKGDEFKVLKKLHPEITRS